MYLVSSQVTAQDNASQDGKSQSNGMFEMLAVYAPDFVLFKRVTDKEIKQVDVYFVFGETSAKGLRSYYTGKKAGVENQYRITNFDIPDLLLLTSDAEKIKIVVDGVEMFYNINEAKWEK